MHQKMQLLSMTWLLKQKLVLNRYFGHYFLLLRGILTFQQKSNRCRNKEIDPVLVIIYEINKTRDHHKT